MTKLGILIAMTFVLSTSMTMMSASETYAHTGSGGGSDKNNPDCVYKHCGWQKGHGTGTCHRHFLNSAGTSSIAKNAARSCNKT